MTVPRPLVLLAVSALVISLFANAFCVLSLKGLKMDLAQILNQQMSYLQSARSEIAGLRAQLSEMNQAARWYSHPELSFAGLGEPGKAPVARVTWTFQDLAASAKVHFSYRLPGTDWQDAEPVRAAGNTFLAEIPLAGISQTPVIDGAVHSASGKPSRAVRVEEFVGNDSSMLLEYVIHAKDGAGSKSGETERVSLSKLAPRFSVEVTETDGLSYPVMVRRDSRGLGTAAIKQVSASALNRGVTVASLDLVAASGVDAWTGVLKLQSGAMADVLRVAITMPDGVVVTKDIHLR